MKKLIVFLLCITINSFAKDLVDIQPNVVKHLEFGINEGELGFKLERLRFEGTPRGLGIDKNYLFYISDDGNKRLNIYNNDLIPMKPIINLNLLCSTERFEFNDDSTVTRRVESASILKLNFQDELIIDLNFDSMEKAGYIEELRYYPNDDYFIFYKDIVFFYTRDMKILSVKNPTTDNVVNRKNFRNSEQTRALFKPHYKGLYIDEKDRLILNGRIQTRDQIHFIEYWKEKHKGMVKPAHAIDDDVANVRMRSDYFRFIGTDSDQNLYWQSGSDKELVTVFDCDGWCIAMYDIPRDSKVKAFSSIAPTGDVYYLAYVHPNSKDYKGANILMVPRYWGYIKTTPGTSTADKVNVRLRPSTTSVKVTQLKKDEAVEVLDTTDIKLKVGATENYWYKVKTGNGLMGWVYGDFIKTE
ncbi:MAG: hypothetical protein A2015_08525 [Spirochaetes bacterium GWF1_31_7]|nr:MAG: hypothetical protein A2Y30_07135 [Spirochaetes bacterium GWE1_32_154]OHD47968.1 MAG: hypothetical protein A2015_08525 [Spirochaetes bacterium GWF1_31_7]OHD48059.1 MAG: hypothetical protein A2Y29_07860 [Spirochaetes bacterium GWE2_31_10]OHD78655.1 MAG: hypothetical protein A2355_16925 [Spirochaetes bacterium RIFOXYB1_FULL_32_8]